MTEKPPASEHIASKVPVNRVFIAIVLIALILALYLQTRPPQRALFLALNAWASQYSPSVWSFLTLLGDGGVLFTVLSPLLLWRPQAMFAVLAAVPLGALSSVALKALFQAPRPATLIDPGLFTVIGPLLNNASFPSGHTLAAFAAAVAVLAVVVQGRKAEAVAATPARLLSRPDLVKTTALAAATLGLAALVGFSRIAVGAHWPVDVLAGAACGSLAGWSGAWITQRYPRVWNSLVGQFLYGQVLLVTAMWQVLHPSDYPQGALAVALGIVCGVGTVVRQWFAMWRNAGSKAASKSV